MLACVLAGAIAALLLSRAERAPPALERATLFGAPRALPDFALVDHSGAAFGPGRLRGQWTLLFFGFTNCPDVCPTTLASLAEVRRGLADLPPARQPQVMLVSVDPARDTPQALAGYVAHFDPAFIGATGTAASIDALTRALGVAVIAGAPDANGQYSVDHSAAIFLVDPEARQAALFGAPHAAATIAADFRRIVAARAH